MLHPIGNSLMIMFEVILGMCYWGMMNHVKLLERGKVQIKLNNGSEWLLKDVRYIPTMKINMISIGQLGDGGCLSTFGETWWKIN